MTLQEKEKYKGTDIKKMIKKGIALP